MNEVIGPSRSGHARVMRHAVAAHGNPALRPTPTAPAADGAAPWNSAGRSNGEEESAAEGLTLSVERSGLGGTCQYSQLIGQNQPAFP